MRRQKIAPILLLHWIPTKLAFLVFLVVLGVSIGFTVNRPKTPEPEVTPAPENPQPNPPGSLGKSKSSPKGSPSPELIARWQVVRAFLRVTMYAEGTWHPTVKRDPYRTQFTFRVVPEAYAFKQHPYFSDGVIPCANSSAVGRLCSAASGALQWMPDTWVPLRQRNRDKHWFRNDPEFSPRNQDMAGIYKLDEIGVFRRLMNGIAFKGGRVTVNRKNFDAAVYHAAPVWASFPTHANDTHGAYSQGARDIDRLWKVFTQELDREHQQWLQASK